MNDSDISDLKEKETQTLFGCMINGYTEKFILIFIEQMKMLVGILNGLVRSLIVY